MSLTVTSKLLIYIGKSEIEFNIKSNNYCKDVNR